MSNDKPPVQVKKPAKVWSPSSNKGNIWKETAKPAVKPTNK